MSRTPGPWRYGALSASVITQNGQLIADLSDRDDAYMQADGRLIAKAPEMRTMLDRLLREWLSYTDFEREAHALLTEIDND